MLWDGGRAKQKLWPSGLPAHKNTRPKNTTMVPVEMCETTAKTKERFAGTVIYGPRWQVKRQGVVQEGRQGAQAW